MAASNVQNYFRTIGFLNEIAPDLSGMSNKPVPTVGICRPCCFATENTRRDDCPKCGYALEWRLFTGKVRTFVEIHCSL